MNNNTIKLTQSLICDGGLHIHNDNIDIHICPSNSYSNTNVNNVNINNINNHNVERKLYCNITPQLTENVLKIWKENFPDAKVLVWPSESNPSVTITHTINGSKLPFPTMSNTINGIEWKNPLTQNALYSFECSKEGIWGNFHEIMLDEVPGVLGSPSAAEAYTNYIAKNDIFVQGDHYHWKGTVPNMYAIHIARSGMDPILFSQITNKALAEYTRVANINKNINNNFNR